MGLNSLIWSQNKLVFTNQDIYVVQVLNIKKNYEGLKKKFKMQLL